MHEPTPLEKRLLERLEPEIAALGFECVELTFATEAGRRVLRVTLDAEGGVTLDACAAVSRGLGAILDGWTDIPEHYVLEVSSPGINRLLTKPEHFRKHRGERVKIRLREKLDGGATISGVLRDLDGDVLLVETTVGTKRVPLALVARARLHRDVDALLRQASRRADATPGTPEVAERRWKR
jgi:ribosome maturation factor RimP